MKKIGLIVFIGASSSCLFAQKIEEKEIPELVKTTFHSRFPEAKGISWDKEGDKYEASFDLKKTDNSVLFDSNGNVLETETEIEIKQLPQNVLSYIKTTYLNQKVLEAAKISDANGKVTYEAEIKGKDLLFDVNGTFIKEVID